MHTPVVSRSREVAVHARRRTGGATHRGHAWRGIAGMSLLLAAGVAACNRAEETPDRAPPSVSERALVTAGELQAGQPDRGAPVANPVADVANATGEGRRLYMWFNCAGCHGTEGGGGIGPPLRDAEWIYGGNPASIFQSIAQGRPNGMPAFGGKIPDEQIWRIELYVRSLSGESGGRAGSSSGESPTEAQRKR